MTAILGISAFYHDSAAALVVDGEIVAAAQEERFSRKKYDEAFPQQSVDYCLGAAGLQHGDIDYVAFYDKPFLKFQRLLETYLAYAPAGFESFTKALPLWLNRKLHLQRELKAGLRDAYRRRFIFLEHHESHAASAFYPSPFDEAAILTLDGVGEWATATFGVGRGHRMELTHEQQFPHSLGLLYSAFTYYCGFRVNSGEYKLMGLAPYGTPRYADSIRDTLLDLKDDGSFRMDMLYFNYCQGLTMTSEKFHSLFGGPPRQPDTLLTERDMDLAASIQKVTEDVMLRSARHVQQLTGMRNLCLAGGVALNCVGNGRILRESPFERLWIQPAAGDAGGALGAALFVWHQLLDQPRTPKARDAQHASLLGPEFTADEIQTYLDGVGAIYERIDDQTVLADTIAGEIERGAAIGWFQGRMEFGPRALGSRSILGDPRSPKTQTTLNVKVKFRESFRPFAPAVLAEHASSGIFDVDDTVDSPYMLLVAPVADERRTPVTPEQGQATGIDKLRVTRSVVPAITHVDYSARVQTVDERHGLYRKVIEAFYRRTGCPIVVNTSFNLGWDPIVCRPEEAYTTFMSCDLDVLCVGPFVLRKSQQPAWVTNEPGRSRHMIEDIWRCPCGSGAALERTGDAIAGRSCGHRFPVVNGVPRFSQRPQVTASRTPSAVAVDAGSPDSFESVRTMIETARQDPFARRLEAAIPYNSRVLEFGCDTGELSIFLGVPARQVVGADIVSRA